MYQKREKYDQVVEKFPVEYYGLRFEPQIQQNKLFIKVYDDKTNVFKYSGCMDLTPNMDINSICEILKKRDLTIQEINEDKLIIHLGMIRINFTSVLKHQKNELQERLRKLEQRQYSYKQTTDKQSKKIDQLQKAMEQLKQSIVESLKSEIDKNIKTINFRLEANSGTLDEHENQLIQLKKLNDQKMEIDKFIEEKQNILKSIDSQKVQLEKMDKKYQSQLNKINKLISEQSFQMVTRVNEIESISSSLKCQKNQFSQKIKQLSSQINTRANQIKSISSSLKFEKNKISQQNLAILKTKEQINERIEMFRLPWGFSHLNQPIKSSKWSTQLKSKHITISGNVVQLQPQTSFLSSLIGYSQFCLLNASFSNTLKQKQSWAIQMKKMTRRIYLGVCLKSKMIKYNFNGGNINWGETGHGLYMVYSSGYCYSHSQKEFNCLYKSFKFGDGDVIYMEYDPIESKLRFRKNLVNKYFELSIIAPPQNDAYHPCVGLYGQNDFVELILCC